MDEATLHAAPLAMDDAHAPKSRAVRFEEVFMHDALDIARRDGVEVENVGYLKADGFGKEVIVVAFVNAFGFSDVRRRRLKLIMRGRIRSGAPGRPPAAKPLQ